MSIILILAGLIISVIVHEIGHYAAYRYYGYKPNVILKMMGIEIGSNVGMDIPREKMIRILLWGVIPGAIALSMIIYNPWAFIVYILLCSADIGNYETLKNEMYKGETPRQYYIRMIGDKSE